MDSRYFSKDEPSSRIGVSRGNLYYHPRQISLIGLRELRMFYNFLFFFFLLFFLFSFISSSFMYIFFVDEKHSCRMSDINRILLLRLRVAKTRRSGHHLDLLLNRSDLTFRV